MSLLPIVVCILAFFRIGSGVYVDEQLMANCRSTYNTSLSNDFLLGEWFEVMQFTSFGGFPPFASCISNVYTRASTDDVTAYIEKYDSPTPSLDDNPVVVSRDNGKFVYLVTGHTEAKDYYMKPGMFTLRHTITNYKRLNEDYMLVWDCQLRGNTIWLQSRINHPKAEDIAPVIAGVPELKELVPQRYCATF